MVLLRVFVVNIATTQAGGPVLMGVSGDAGQTIAIRVLGTAFHVIVEPPLTKTLTEDAARSWAAESFFHEARVSPSQTSYVKRRPLCYRRPEAWVLSICFNSAREASIKASAMERAGFRVHHGRIDPETRFMVTSGIRCFTWVDVTRSTPITERRITRCDHEYTTQLSHVSPAVGAHPAPALRTMAFDMETDGLDHHNDEVRMISAVVDGQRPVLFSRYDIDMDDDDDYDLRVYNEEGPLLAAFCAYVRTSRTIFLTGWNIYGFDMRFLYERSRICGVGDSYQSLSWTTQRVVPVEKTMESSAFGHNDVFDDKLAGIIVLDGYLIARKSLQLESYSLKTMAKRIGKAKGDVSYQDMLEAFTTRDPCLLRDVATYCVNDTVLVPLILASIEQPANTMAMATLTCSTPAQVLKRGQSILIYNLILAEALPSGYFVNAPPKPIKGTTVDTKYEGATVLEPKRGFYSDPVVCLDFSSLYPSLMRGYNLCTSTLFADSETVFPDAVTRVDVGNGRTVVFDTAGDEGVMPRILRVLLQRRKDVRKTMADMPRDSDDYRMANAKQLALKICANSLYGFFGFQFAQIYMKDLAASVTSLGRASLLRVVNMLEGEKRLVVYGDTDSVFVLLPGVTESGAEAIAHDISKRATSMFPQPMALEYEKTFTTSLFMTKKRYAGLIDGEVYTKGLSTNRRDFPPFVQKVLRDALHTLLNKGDIVRSVSDNLETLVSHGVQQHDLSITKELKKNFDNVASLMGVVDTNHRQGAYLWKSITVTNEFLRQWRGMDDAKIVAELAKDPAVRFSPLLKNTYASLPPVAVLARQLRKIDPSSAPKVGDRVTFIVGKGVGSVSDRAALPGSGIEPDLVYYTEQALDQVEDLMLNSGMEREFDRLRTEFMRKATHVRDRQSSILSFFAKKAKSM